MSGSEKLKVALCGLGEIGQFHLQAINDSEFAELVAVCELDRDLAGRSVGDRVAIHDDLGTMLDEVAPDVVDVCLPHHLHEPVAVQALEAGSHVILEKPMAVDVAGCDRIAAAADAADRKVGISYNQIFFGPHRRLAQMLAEGSLGDLRSLYLRLWMGGKYGGWREDASRVGGGLLMDAGVHRVYMATALGGPVESVTAGMDRPRNEDAFAINLNFRSGATGVIQGAYHGPQGVFDDRIEVQASEGMAEVLGCEAFFEGDLIGPVQLRTRIDGKWSDDEVTDAWDNSVRASVCSILESLAAGQEPLIGPLRGRETMAVIEAAYSAAEFGKTIRVEDPLNRRAA